MPPTSPIKALLALAVLAGGLAATTTAADKAPPPAEDRKAPDKQVDPFGGLPLPLGDPEELLKLLGGQFDEQTMKELREQMELTRRMMDQLRRGLPNARRGGGMPQLPNLFPQVPNRLDRGRGPRGMDGRLGARVEPPTSALVDQLDLPKGQGMVLLDVKGDSAASKAGLKDNDVLLELDGQPVPSDPAKFAEFMAGVKVDEAVEAVILRKTKKETVKGVKLPKVAQLPQQAPRLPNVQVIPLEAPPAVAGGNSVSVSRTNDAFKVVEKQDGATTRVSGKVVDGKAELEKVVVEENRKATEYQKLADVPAGQREKVEKLLKMAAGKPVILNNVVD